MKRLTISLATAVALTAPAVMAQDDFSAQLKARQGQFRIMALNLGILGGMAQGKIDYDEETAQEAADTLVAVSSISQAPHWPEGTDNFSIDGTRAQVSIWEDNADFIAKWADFGEAAQEMQAAAGDGTEAIGQALNEVGGTCKACHDTHRAPES
ncbi:MAG: c-type cytochrome [Paracoccaceae bacterium]